MKHFKQKILQKKYFTEYTLVRTFTYHIIKKKHCVEYIFYGRNLKKLNTYLIPHS